MADTRLGSLRWEPGFLTKPASQLLVRDADEPPPAVEMHAGNRVPVAPTTTFTELYSNHAPKTSLTRGCDGSGVPCSACTNLPAVESDLARSAELCAELCAADELCRFIHVNANGRCCLLQDYDESGGLWDYTDRIQTGEVPISGFYALQTRAAEPRDDPSVSAPFAILQPLLRTAEIIKENNDGEHLYGGPYRGTGTRMRAFFGPSVTGNYSFTARCIGSCEVWLATTDGAPVQIAASRSGWTQHDMGVAQAEPQWLDAGRYYLLVAPVCDTGHLAKCPVSQTDLGLQTT